MLSGKNDTLKEICSVLCEMNDSLNQIAASADHMVN